MFVWDRPPAFQGKITESEIESSPHSCKKVTLPPPLTLKFLLHLCLMSHARVELYVVPSLNTQSCIRRIVGGMKFCFPESKFHHKCRFNVCNEKLEKKIKVKRRYHSNAFSLY